MVGHEALKCEEWTKTRDVTRSTKWPARTCNYFLVDFIIFFLQTSTIFYLPSPPPVFWPMMAYGVLCITTRSMYNVPVHNHPHAPITQIYTTTPLSPGNPTADSESFCRFAQSSLRSSTLAAENSPQALPTPLYTCDAP